MQSNGREFRPERIAPIDVRKYRGHLRRIKNCKPATVNRNVSSISAFCEWAREAELVPANPADGISQVDEVRAAPKWLDKNEQYALLSAVQEKGRQRDVALITLMLNTGLPVSEISKTLRHTCGKDLADAGVWLDRVAQLLGHESVDTTRIYTTGREHDLQREVEKTAVA